MGLRTISSFTVEAGQVMCWRYIVMMAGLLLFQFRNRI